MKWTKYDTILCINGLCAGYLLGRTNMDISIIIAWVLVVATTVYFKSKLEK